MNRFSVIKSSVFALIAIAFVSCDDDFNVLGADIVGADNFNFDHKTFQVTAATQNLGAIESNNLVINPLGIYDNPVFGLTKANFVTQVNLVTPSTIDIDLALQPVIDSVILSVPYFSTKLSTATNSTSTYRLDSIYGPKTPRSPFKLNIYESGYYIRDINPVDQLTQPYYSDQNADFDMAKLGSPLNDDSNVTQNQQFLVNEREIAEYKMVSGKKTLVRSAPAIRVKLSKSFFDRKIFHAPAGKLENNNVFKEYFRGLYFQVDKNGSEPGNMAMLNFRGGIITIYYTESTDRTVTKTIGLNFNNEVGSSGGVMSICNSVSLIDQGNPYVAADSQKLFLKGGANNSMAVIDLFGPGELEQLRDEKLLINDAALTFTIDKSTMNLGSTKAVEPNRVYLYDLTNKKALVDYDLDESSNTAKPKYSKNLFGGILKKEEDGRGITYKIRLTQHVFRMVKLDSANVRLGLVVTENINIATNKKIKTPALGGTIKTIPLMSAVNPLGTVLFGSNIPEGDVNYDKRPKFEIYYTKPKQN